MAWQEELKVLNEALANGTISQAEHRKRRDEILAAASSTAAPASARTQAASTPEDDPDTTQRVSTVTAPPAPWTTRPPDPAYRPPPPPMVAPGPQTFMQGHEIFAGARPRRRPWLLPVVVLAVLALAAGAVWWPGFVGDDPQPRAPSGGIDRLNLPGTEDGRSGRLTTRQARERKVFTDREINLLEQAGMTELTYVGATDGPTAYGVYVYKTVNVEAVLRIHQQLGLVDGDKGQLPDAVRVSQLRNDRGAILRAVYTSGGSTILVSVLQVPPGEAGALRQDFDRAVGLVLEAAPPG